MYSYPRCWCFFCRYFLYHIHPIFYKHAALGGKPNNADVTVFISTLSIYKCNRFLKFAAILATFVKLTKNFFWLPAQKELVSQKKFLKLVILTFTFMFEV